MKYSSIIDMLNSKDNSDIDLAMNILYNQRNQLEKFLTYRQAKILHMALIEKLPNYKLEKPVGTQANPHVQMQPTTTVSTNPGAGGSGVYTGSTNPTPFGSGIITSGGTGGAGGTASMYSASNYPTYPYYSPIIKLTNNNKAYNKLKAHEKIRKIAVTVFDINAAREAQTT